jgi:hypothetical protein
MSDVTVLDSDASKAIAKVEMLSRTHLSKKKVSGLNLRNRKFQDLNGLDSEFVACEF